MTPATPQQREAAMRQLGALNRKSLVLIIEQFQTIRPPHMAQQHVDTLRTCIARGLRAGPPISDQIVAAIAEQTTK